MLTQVYFTNSTVGEWSPNLKKFIAAAKKIEDIRWPRGDTKFLFDCWKIFHEWAAQTSALFESQVEIKRTISVLQREILVTHGLPFNDIILS